MTAAVDGAPPVGGTVSAEEGRASTRGERWSGVLLMRSGPLAAGVLLAVALAALLLVPVGLWRPVVAAPVILVGLAVAWRVALLVPALPTPPVGGAAHGAPAWAGLVSLAAALGHLGWAAAPHAEHVILRRDAGSYALYAQWIATRAHLPVDARLDAFGGSAALADRAFTLASPAYYQVVHGSGTEASADVVPQFLLGAPAWLSVGYWLGDWTGLLVAPAVLGGAAVLAAAGLTARLVGPRWAPVAAVALAVAQPVLHASRSTYSEPAALLLVLAAASVLVDATSVRAATRVPAEGSVEVPAEASAQAPFPVPVGASARALGFVAGAFAGLAGLVRVDALREVALLLPVAAVLAVRRHPAAGPLAAGALGGITLSGLAAVWLSRPYLGSIAGSLLPLVGITVVLGVGSAVTVRIHRRRAGSGAADGAADPAGSGTGDGAADRGGPSWSRRLPEITAGLVVGAGAALASRPLWQTVHQSPDDPGSRYVAGLQRGLGLPVDGARTYAEHSVQWVSWWTGPVALLLALGTYAVLAGRAVSWLRRRREDVPGWLGPAVVAFGSTVLTLYRPGITPDHPWADRRLVPVVLPAVVIAATAAVAWLTPSARDLVRGRGAAPRTVLAARAVAVAGVVAVVLPALLATWPVATDRTERGQLAAVRTVCRSLGPRDAVLVLDNRGRNEWPQVIRGVCDRPVAVIAAWRESDEAAAATRIAGRIAAAGYRPVLLETTDPARLAALGLDPVHIVSLRTTEDQRLLVRRPDGVAGLTVEVWTAAWTGG